MLLPEMIFLQENLHGVSVGKSVLNAGGYSQLAGMLDRTKAESNRMGFLFHRPGALFCPYTSELQAF